MATEREVYQIVLQLKDELTASLKNVQSQLGKTVAAGNAVKTQVGGFQKAFGNLAQGIISVIGPMVAARAAMRLLREVFIEGIKGAIEEEQAAIKLSASIRAVGQAGNISAPGLIKFAEELMNTTTFTHEATQAAMGYLIQIGNFTEAGVRKAIPVLMDYAAAMGIDIATAAEQMSFAMEGGRNSFIKYGVVLKDTMTPTEKFNAIVNGLSASFSGMAGEMAKTTSGQLTQLKNTLDEIKAAGGALLLEFGGPFIRWLGEAARGLNSLVAQTLEYHQILSRFAAGETLTAPETILRQKGEIDYLNSQRKKIESDIMNVSISMARAGPDAIAKATAPLRAQMVEIDKNIAARKRAIVEIEKMISDIGKPKGEAVVTGAGVGAEPAGKGYEATGAEIAHLYEAARADLAIIAQYTQAPIIALTEEQQLLAIKIQMQKKVIALRKEEQQMGLSSEEIEARRLAKEKLKTLELKKQQALILDQMKLQLNPILESSIIGIADAFAQAAVGAQTFDDSMRALLQTILHSLGTMMIQAGLKMIMAGAIPLGIALLAAGGFTLVGSAAFGPKQNQGIANPAAMATGGIVTRPTLALLGESGAEAVVPLTNPYRGRGYGGGAGIGGITINAPNARYLDARTAGQLVRLGLVAMRS